jgi:hypothetical protein
MYKTVASSECEPSGIWSPTYPVSLPPSLETLRILRNPMEDNDFPSNRGQGRWIPEVALRAQILWQSHSIKTVDRE